MSAFSNDGVTIEDQIAEGDKVLNRWSSKSTHSGEFGGVPATGKQVTMTGTEGVRNAGGKVEEAWSEADIMGSMQQLGVVPHSQEDSSVSRA